MTCRLNVVALSLVALLVLPVAAQAEEDKNSRISIEFQRDPDGKLSPDTYFPYKWSDNWFSGLGYRNTSQFTSEPLAGLPESKIATLTDDRRIRLNLLSYTNGGEGLKYSIGADVQRIDINRNEFGYLHLVMTTPAINDWVAIDNRVKLGINSFALRGDMTLGGDKETSYMVRVGLNVAPTSTLSVTQETDFRPVVASTGMSNTASTQKLNWEATLETRYRVVDWMSVGLDARYEVMPFKYQVAQLNSTIDGFTPADIESTDTTTRVGIKLIFKTKEMALHPLIGVARESVNTKDELAGTSSKIDRTLVLLGMTGQF